MNLLVSFRSEILKTRRTATFYFTLIAAAVIPCLSLLAVLLDGPDINLKENAFSALLRMRFSFLCGLILPLYIMLMCTMLAQMEYRNNTWKQVFTSPQPMVNVFIARFLNVQMMILLFLLMYNIFLIISIVCIHYMEPSLHLLDRPHSWGELVSRNAKTYISILALSSMQFWLSVRFRNFIVALGIGLALWFVGTMMVLDYHAPYAYLFPYTYTAYTAFPKEDNISDSVRVAIQFASVGYMLLFLMLGFVSFRKGKR